MECQYCSKLCKNKNSLTQHQNKCKLNPNKIESYFTLYNKKIKNGEITKSNNNQYTKAQNLGLDKPIITEETRKKLGAGGRNQIWTKERREKHSIVMIKATIEHSDSYSANNVCGRTKLIELYDSYGNITKVNGGWEKIVADYLNDNNIKWTNKIEEKIYYFWNGKERIYYPDFYLPDHDKYIEVKGYQRERDLLKWEVIKDRLIIIKNKEIKEKLINLKCLIGAIG